ncbi:hypothetical protein [Rufibacter roseus]|uniref:RHS repeat-associated core domain-containing protein n=1 Tax=Rufibacter roseus TaxID=1567108 RepID=A0ABW2DED7_9BACT|nr:hypothetical protein [Rufibacter roseus]
MKQHRVKVQRKYVSLPGLIKMRPYHLEKETTVDTLGRIVKHKAYRYSSSLFDNLSAVTHESFEYDARGYLISYLQSYLVEHQNYDNYSSKVAEIWYGYDSLGWVKFASYVYPSRLVKHMSDTLRVQNPHVNKMLSLFVVPGEGMGVAETSTSIGSNDPSTNEYVHQTVDNYGRFIIERGIVLDNGKQVRQIVQASAYQGNVTTTNFQYNSEGLVSEQEVVDKDGRRLKKILFKYHTNGLVHMISTYGKNKQLVKKEKYEYEYY